ncbi:MAG: glycosyl hydrolase family 65 protein [Hungatella sp.]
MEENRKSVYPVEPWCVTEESFSMDTNYRNETTFSLSNGYLGTRGTMEEGYDFSVEEGLEGNFINGFYEQEDIRYGEWNYGFPTTSQSLMNLPNGKTIKLFLDEEELDIRNGKVEDYHRTLHMDEGILTRSFLWTSQKGKTVRIETSRFVSFAKKNLMEMSYKATPVNFDGHLLFVSILDANVENHTRKTNPLVDYGPFGRHLEVRKLRAEEDILYYEGIAQNSRLSMACGIGHHVDGGKTVHMHGLVCEDELFGEMRIEVTAVRGETVTLEKQIAYTSSLDMEDCKMEIFIRGLLSETGKRSYRADEEIQKAMVKDMWKKADVGICGDDALQQGIRFNLFHILQSAPRDGKTGMGAKGLSGEGYEGHYFWDTEMYVIPILVYINPELAKALLRYRYKTLDEARARARVLGHEKGALYPWRTINGKEASTYYPLGTAQYHIDADIAYAFKLYLDVTGDMEFLKEAAAEVLVETARVWADVGCFAESRDGRYCICAVTGPDEYNAIVDNNFYTNLMARENLRDAVWALDTLKTLDGEVYQNLLKQIDFQEEERSVWEKIIEKMYFPYDEKRKIYPLDDGFLIRKVWDESKIPVEKRHLLYENYHPLFIFRQRMSKQADAILGMYLHSNLFTKEELQRNYDFYQEVTLHHSSLSTCIFGILACQIGYEEESYHYFAQSARMDLDDYHHNFYAGIHAANMAGTWQAIVNGFAGLRMNRGYLEFWPTLPKAWDGYEFRLNYKGNLLKIQVDRQEIQVILLEGQEASFWLCGKQWILKKEGDYAKEKR